MRRTRRMKMTKYLLTFRALKLEIRKQSRKKPKQKHEKKYKRRKRR
uniref:Uncharacterized protein n=1 Tax=Rhizophora mucronata TaxID=61149 RepID=A0A2P2JA28_RHIMU